MPYTILPFPCFPYSFCSHSSTVLFTVDFTGAGDCTRTVEVRRRTSPPARFSSEPTTGVTVLVWLVLIELPELLCDRSSNCNRDQQLMIFYKCNEAFLDNHPQWHGTKLLTFWRVRSSPKRSLIPFQSKCSPKKISLHLATMKALDFIQTSNWNSNIQIETKFINSLKPEISAWPYSFNLTRSSGKNLWLFTLCDEVSNNLLMPFFARCSYKVSSKLVNWLHSYYGWGTDKHISIFPLIQ
jgi:hypothetical protein